MEMRKLGKDGIEVSAIGLGCWSFASPYGATDENESHETLKKALDLGITFLDTANVYGAGVSERAIGSFIKDNPGKFTIATKAGIYRDPKTNIRSFNNSPEHLREALEKSLTHLGLEYVDLYYIHRREAERPIEEVMDTLLRFKNEGKIGAIGFSEISPTSLQRAHAVHPVSAVQSEYSLWTRMPELGVIQACKRLGVAFVPFSPLGRGMLSSVTPDPSSFSDSDFRKINPRFVEPNFSNNLKAIEGFKSYAYERGTTPSTLAIAWTLAKGEHHIPIPGTRSAEHLEENATAIDLKLTPQDMEDLDQILPPGFACGERYTQAQGAGAERFC